MSALAAVLTTMLEPVVSASATVVWAPAALLAAAAQSERPSGPAPRANPQPARSALALVVLGLGLAVMQLLAAVAALRGWVDAPSAVGTWPAAAASTTGGALVLVGAVRPLLQLRGGRALTDASRLNRMNAALRTGVAAGALATVAATLGAGVEPVEGSAGPYLAPTLLVAAAVFAVHALLRSGAVAR